MACCSGRVLVSDQTAALSAALPVVEGEAMAMALVVRKRKTANLKCHTSRPEEANRKPQQQSWRASFPLVPLLLVVGTEREV